MSTTHGPEGRQTVHYDVNDPADLAIVTKAGLIWNTAYAQKGIDAIVSGEIPLAECKDIPPAIHEALMKRLT